MAMQALVYHFYSMAHIILGTNTLILMTSGMIALPLKQWWEVICSLLEKQPVCVEVFQRNS